MNKQFFLIIAGVFLMGLFACETMEDPEIKNTSTWPMNGEYWVKHDNTATGNPYLSGRHKMIISNTAADDGDSILIDDGGIGAMFKAAVDMDALTFSVADYPIDDTTTLSISNGKLLREATVTKTEEIPTDSIYMEIEWVTPGGTDQITISGSKYTGWPEDNY